MTWWCFLLNVKMSQRGVTLVLSQVILKVPLSYSQITLKLLSSCFQITLNYAHVTFGLPNVVLSKCCFEKMLF